LLLKYAANIWGYATAKNEAKGEKCGSQQGGERPHATRQNKNFLRVRSTSQFATSLAVTFTEINSPRIFPHRCPWSVNCLLLVQTATKK